MSEQKDEKPVEKIKQDVQQAVRAKSAPALVRRYRAVFFLTMLALVIGAFAMLTFLVRIMPAFAVDLQVTKTLQLIKFPFFASMMDWISWIGFAPQAVIIAGLIILLIYAFGLQWESVMALFAAVFSAAVNALVKDLVGRPRPNSNSVNVFGTLTSYSFPSGHVMFYLVFFGFIAFLVFSLSKPSLKRTLLMVFLGSLIILVGPSRIYLGQHWASDVLGAYLLGSLTLAAIIQFYRWGKTRFFVHQPVAAAPTQV
ncbi:MAG: phosphatase PAP2 family protein [Chloroflexi bacterium]|nr:phosphatase PAP2 family protein [Chloroflexota bacterium]